MACTGTSEPLRLAHELKLIALSWIVLVAAQLSASTGDCPGTTRRSTFTFTRGTWGAPLERDVCRQDAPEEGPVNRAVLIVDDHPVIHEVLRQVVREVYAGATVYSEMDLPGAVRRVRAARRVDLVLLDLGLPGCAGIEALTRFRESAGEVPVAIISACTDAPMVRAALNAGAIGYLPKS